ncbi:GRC3 [Candida jiufengensis]|uniref:GRC3 n=1 Tax=Candida jiufengensis TaxID=497108 RepID=UPI002224930B|nr:GRC3 [Candida jiufengensis]KAI5957096.1 GRC3 [Candida jiufengensis]
MSAYAALKSGLSLTGSQNPSNDKSMVNDELDDTILQYTKDSDDEDDNEEEDSDEITNEAQTRLYKDDTTNPQGGPLNSNTHNIISQSNFIPNNTNLNFFDDHILLKLHNPEFIIIKGQFKMEIIEGEVQLNNCYNMASDSKKIYSFKSSGAQALPIVSHASADNIAVLKLINLKNGLENLHKIYSQRSSAVSDQDNLFRNYTFEIVIKESEDESCGLYIPDTWSKMFKSIANSPLNSLMVIGHKNTGKSTFSKCFMDYLLLHRKRPVVLMDLDPGQSEYSSPYCMSLSIHYEASFCEDLSKDDKTELYYGFTSPMESPSRFLNIVQRLFDTYSSTYLHKGYVLIINTPGWIKGYGKELLVKISNIINPSDLCLLSHKLSLDAEENQTTLNGLSYSNVHLVSGIFSNQELSASQIRCINKLLYFHKISNNCFDFSRYMLDVPPLKLSYCINNSEVGINALCVLNYKLKSTQEFALLRLLLETMIWGIYATSSKTFTPTKNTSSKYPNLINMETLKRISNDDQESQFLGLLAIHSINFKEQYFNIYAPPDVISKLQTHLNSNYKIILVRGEGNLPAPEIMYPNFLQHIDNSKTNTTKQVNRIPYLSFKAKPKVGGIWKVRRNIIRKNQR